LMILTNIFQFCQEAKRAEALQILKFHAILNIFRILGLQLKLECENIFTLPF